MGLITASSIKFNLRTPHRVVGYYIYDVMDNDVADIRDLLVDEQTREPRYAMIEIGGLMRIKGKKLLIPWAAMEKGGISRMDVRLPEEEVVAAPAPLDPLAPSRAEEEMIHRYFNVDPYWLDEKGHEAEPEGEVKDETPIERPPVDDKPITGLSLERNDEEKE